MLNTVKATKEEIALNNLLADLEMSDDIVVSEEVSDGEFAIEAAISEIESDEVVEEIVEPEVVIEATPVEDKEAKKAAKAEAAAAKKLERETARLAKKAAKAEAEKDKPVRKYYSNKIDRLEDRFGADLVTGVQLEVGKEENHTETLEMMHSTGSKVQNRMSFILEFVAHKASKLNDPAKIAFNLLHDDGFLSTGEKGNYLQALVAHPYSLNSAKSMGGNTILAMKSLKIIVLGEKGHFVANPDSVILEKMNDMLGIGL